MLMYIPPMWKPHGVIFISKFLEPFIANFIWSTFYPFIFLSM